MYAYMEPVRAAVRGIYEAHVPHIHGQKKKKHMTERTMCTLNK